jgi:lipoprotein-releasing system permease protein
MNVPYFIAKRISIFDKKSFSLFITKIAILAIALSVSVMVIGTAITQGYQQQISEKFYDCWGHLQVTTFLADPNSLMNDDKIKRDSLLEKKLSMVNNVKSITTYALQSCILKINDDMDGVMLKGLDLKNSHSEFDKYLLEGKNLTTSSTSKYANDIIISKTMSEKLNIKLGDKIILYFIDKEVFQPKARRVFVKGIYNTGLEDYDKLFVLCDTKLIQDVNHEDGNIIQGYEIYLKDKSFSKEAEKEIFDLIDAPLEVYPIESRFANIFSWLDMMKMNERIIILIMMIIAFINMTTALLILILERTRMIGVLKSIGMTNGLIKRIFLYTSSYIVLFGILLGVILGVGLCLLQQRFHFITLNESAYFLKSIPIYLNIFTLIGIVFSTLIFALLILLIPSILVNKISPSKAVQFR